MATHIKDLLNKFFKESGKKFKDKEKIQKIIDELLEDNIKKRIRLSGIDKNKVVIYSNSSSVKYELILKKKEILEAIRKEFPAIEDIQIRIE